MAECLVTIWLLEPNCLYAEATMLISEATFLSQADREQEARLLRRLKLLREKFTDFLVAYITE